MRESSKLVTFFARSDGRLTGIAKGARRPGNRFGAALEPFALAEITWYRHQQKTVFTITEAALKTCHPGITAEPARFLAAEQVVEFLLRTIGEHDPNEQLWRLALVYLAEIERADNRLPALVASFLLKGASFVGFRPEVRRCLGCNRPAETAETGPASSLSSSLPWRFDIRRGGAVCPDCGVAPDAPAVSSARLALLERLLYSPANELEPLSSDPELFELVGAFLCGHLEALRLNSLSCAAGASGYWRNQP